MKQLVPSKYQVAVENEYTTTNNNILISARAGSGKTTVLRMLLYKTPENKECMLVAFNKHIVNELKDKIPQTKNITIGTLHSRGYQAICINHRGKIKLEDWKTFKIVKAKLANNWKDVPKRKINTKIYNIAQFYDIYRLTNQQNLAKFDDLVEKYNLNVTKDDIPKIKQVLWELNEYNENHNKFSEFLIDFVDMVYLPVYLDMPIKQVDVLMVDEAQDLSALQHVFVKKMLKEGGRIIYVGDEFQGIYGFGGSDIDSWTKIKETPNIVELPLSYCYRCGKNIVDKANMVHDGTESPDWIHDGEVIENGNFFAVQPNDFIVCRNTKPLVDLYFYFLEREMAAFIKGSDIGRGLAKTIEPFRGASCADLIIGMKKELNEIYKFLVEHGVEQPQRNPKYITYDEKLQIVTTLSWKCKTTDDMIDLIYKIFAEDGKGIILSTVHKAKGLEADTVYFYLPHLIPSKYATKNWELQQEDNLMYVAITRAKKKLIFVRNEINAT